jgi:glutamyl-tRNA reductase
MGVLRLQDILAVKDYNETPNIPDMLQNMFGSTKSKRQKRAKSKKKLIKKNTKCIKKWLKHIKKMAKKFKIKTKGKSPIQVLSSLDKKGAQIVEHKYMQKHIKSMAKCLFTKSELKTKLRATLRSMWKQIITRLKDVIKEYKKSKGNSFGTWWDNTQREYSTVCASRQCADAQTIGGQFPYYTSESDYYTPYTPIY